MLLRCATALSGMRAVATKRREGRWRWSGLAMLCLAASCLVYSMCWLTFRFALRDSNGPVDQIGRVLSVLCQPLILIGGWFATGCGLLDVRAAGKDEEEEEEAEGKEGEARRDTEGQEETRWHTQSRRDVGTHVAHALPPSISALLAAGLLLATCVVCVAVGVEVHLYASGQRSGALRMVMDVAWFPVEVVCLLCPLYALAAMMCARALHFARRVAAVARKLPQWRVEHATEALQREQRLLDAYMHSTPLVLLIAGDALVVLVGVCLAVHILTGATLGVPIALANSLYALVSVLPTMTALYCVAEVTEAWLTLPRALFVQPPGAAPDPARTMAGLQLMELRLQGLLGVRVCGVSVSRALVVKWLWSVGTLAGVLLQLQRSGDRSS